MYKPNDKVMVYCTIERVIEDKDGVSYLVRADCKNSILKTMEVPMDCVTSSNEIIESMEEYASKQDR